MKFGEMTGYTSIVFMQGDDYDEADKEIEAMTKADTSLDWTDAAIAYLSQWDSGDGGETRSIAEGPGHGTSDSVFERGDYLVCLNERMGYIGLTRIDRFNGKK